MDKHISEFDIADSQFASDQQFRLLVEGIAIAVWETDASGIIAVDSPSWRHVTGQTLSEFMGSHWYDTIHTDDIQFIMASWNACVHDKVIFNAEFRLRRADGSWSWTQGHVAPMCDNEGKLSKWVGMIVDISERKQAEQVLVKRERQLQLALDISRTSFWNYNLKDNSVFMDARMRSMWGESDNQDTFPIERVMARIHPDDRPLVADAVNAALDPTSEGIYLPNDYRIVLDDGSIRWLAANGLTIFSGRGNERQSVELIGTVLDITSRKAIEDSLRESEDRLQQLNVQLEDRIAARTAELVKSEKRWRAAVDLAEQGRRQLRRLAIELSRTEHRERRRLAQILHDHLQQLLVAAKMRSEVLASDLDNHEFQERLVGIATVIDIAIDATRTLAVELVPPLLHSQGLPAALQWLANHFQEQHGLTIEVNVDSAANPTSEESRDLLFQAAREFLLNIIKHANVKNAQLRLTVEGNCVLLEVSDHGCGFDSDLVANDAPTFGLFHLREHLSAVGGEIVLRSRPGQGTLVCVRIAR